MERGGEVCGKRVEGVWKRGPTWSIACDRLTDAAQSEGRMRLRPESSKPGQEATRLGWEATKEVGVGSWQVRGGMRELGGRCIEEIRGIEVVSSVETGKELNSPPLRPSHPGVPTYSAYCSAVGP